MTEGHHRHSRWYHRYAVSLIVGGICLLCGSGGTVSVRAAYEFADRVWHRESREQTAVKAVHQDLPFAVLDEIRKSEFSVAQVLALGCVESLGNPDAKNDRRNKKGLKLASTCFGWLQVHMRHARNAGLAIEDLYDPVVCARLGLVILQEMSDRYDGNEYDAISSYNCGTTAWDAFLAGESQVPSETVQHWERYQRVKQRLELWIDRGEWIDMPLADWKNPK